MNISRKKLPTRREYHLHGDPTGNTLSDEEFNVNFKLHVTVTLSMHNFFVQLHAIICFKIRRQMSMA